MHTYIVDFTDECNKILYEVKPESIKNLDKCLVKENFAIDYCNSIGYNFEYIHEKYFFDNMGKISEFIETTEDNIKIILLKSLERIVAYYENKKY